MSHHHSIREQAGTPITTEASTTAAPLYPGHTLILGDSFYNSWRVAVRAIYVDTDGCLRIGGSREDYAEHNRRGHCGSRSGRTKPFVWIGAVDPARRIGRTREKPRGTPSMIDSPRLFDRISFTPPVAASPAGDPTDLLCPGSMAAAGSTRVHRGWLRRSPHARRRHAVDDASVFRLLSLAAALLF